jgi:hypothetical protein
LTFYSWHGSVLDVRQCGASHLLLFFMGILDRDYMKRPSDDDGQSDSSSESKAEEFVSRFLQKHPRFFLYVGIGLGALLIIAFIVAMFSETSH